MISDSSCETEVAGVIGTVLGAGESTSFSITRWVEGDYSGPDHVNVFTAVADVMLRVVLAMVGRLRRRDLKGPSAPRRRRSCRRQRDAEGRLRERYERACSRASGAATGSRPGTGFSWPGVTACMVGDRIKKRG